MKISKAKLRQIIKEEISQALDGERIEPNVVYFWSILEPAPLFGPQGADEDRKYLIGSKGKPMVVAVVGPANKSSWVHSRHNSKRLFGKEFGYDARDENMRLVAGPVSQQNARPSPEGFELVGEDHWRPLEETAETALNSPSEAGRQWEAAKMNLTTAATTALEDGLSPRDIRNAIEEILSSAPDEGPRFTSTGPWAPEYRDK
jgi:hypothetical protein